MTNSELSPRDALAAAIAKHGLTVDAVFVPFSQSRNKAEKHKSLNWRVTLRRDGKEVLTTDYSSGIAHCPGYKNPPKVTPPAYQARVRDKICAWECESGKTGVHNDATGNVSPSWINRGAILPDPVDVIWSITRDSDALDYPTFENWASEFGCDPDSRSGEAIYRRCLEIALKMRGFIGEAGLRELTEAGRDF
jgi:hypothetical protein